MADSAQTPKSWIGRLVAACWRYPRMVVAVVLCATLGTGLEAVGPLITRIGVNDAIAGRTDGLGWLVGVLVGLAAIRFVAAFGAATWPVAWP